MLIVSSRIKPLSLQLANQISAGEVVERPASVVKELLENAIDAQSCHIHIEIERGGSALIRISDDGEGIIKEDLALAVTRHATSKLQTLSELEQIISLGFRGEALASISAVSKLSIKSKQAEQEQAWMINTGTESDFADYAAEPEPVAHPQGTTIDVRDLFFNTPARRKFMRTVKTEFRHIDDVVKRIALSRFDIAFKLTHNKKLLRNLPSAETEKSIIQRISKLFSAEFIAHANKVEFSSDHFSNIGTLRLWGWVSAPQWHRKQADWQYFYVNGRYIKDKLVNHALRQAYQELLPEDTFSAYLLYLEIDPQQVDVNVHPTKHEVRFRESRLVHDFIYSALKQALFSEASSADFSGELIESEQLKHSRDPKPAAQINTAPGEYVNRYSQPAYQPKIQSSLNQNMIAEQLKGLKQLYNVSPSNVSPSSNKEVKTTAAAFLGRSLGCLFPNYLLSQSSCENNNVQVLVVHILRAQQYLLLNRFQPGQQAPLLIPETISLTSLEIDSLMKNQAELKLWGLELSQLGEEALTIRSQPSLCGIPGCIIDIEFLIKCILSLSTDFHTSDNTKLMDSELMAMLLKSIRTDFLSQSEQDNLLAMLCEQLEPSGDKQAFVNNKAVWKILQESKLDKLF